MSKPSDFVIEDGVLKRYQGPGESRFDPTLIFGDVCLFAEPAPTHVIVPDGVRRLAREAFMHGYDGVLSITFPASLESIPAHAFGGCGGVNDIYICGKDTVIEAAAFYGCRQMTLHAPKGSLAEAYAKANNIPFAAEE